MKKKKEIIGKFIEKLNEKWKKINEKLINDTQINKKIIKINKNL